MSAILALADIGTKSTYARVSREREEKRAGPPRQGGVLADTRIATDAWAALPHRVTRSSARSYFSRQHQTYKLSSARIREATVMYLRPASWAILTASAIGRLRTEASFTSTGRI